MANKYLSVIPLRNNLNDPRATVQRSAFGTVPEPVPVPQTYYQQVGALYPTLPANTNRYFQNAARQMAGKIPVADVNFIRQLEAEKAVSGGQPGGAVMAGSLYGNRTARDLASWNMMSAIFVEEKSPADKADVRIGDKVEEFEGQAIASLASFNQVHSACTPRQAVTILIRRGPRLLKKKAVLGES